MFSIRESTICFSQLQCDLMWFGFSAFCLCSEGLHSDLANYVVRFFTEHSVIFGGGCGG